MAVDREDISLDKGHIPILTTANYREWIDIVEDHLMSKGLWNYAAKGTLSETQSKEFQMNDAKAVTFLKIAAGREQRAHLLGLKTSKDVLDKLKLVHEVSQENRVQSLLTQFHGFKALKNIDLSASQLTHLQLDIAAASPEERPTDASKKAVLIQSLGTEYQSTVLALHAAGLASMSFDSVIQRLKEVEQLLQAQNSAAAAAEEENLARAAWQQQQQDRPKRDLSKIQCYRCKQYGHFQRNCKQKVQEDKEPAPRRASRRWGIWLGQQATTS